MYGRSSFARVARTPPPERTDEALGPIFATAAEHPPTSLEALVSCFLVALEASVEAWQRGAISDEQALMLDACLREGLLPNHVDQLKDVKTLLSEYRRLEDEIPLPTRVPGLVEADPFDQPLFPRGDHRKPGDAVPRRFLEAVDATVYQTDHSGRLELADSLVHVNNPLTSRVIVNRIWHYLFGQGIVATPDNFGRLGQLPSHPELLDYLATRMVQRGWSIKDTIRFILTSKTWRMDSRPSDAARQVDPDNRLLSHANLRRLDAEAIRDSLLMISEQLDREMYGPGFQANGTTTRRSVYVTSRRNSLDDFLQVFDAPEPFATKGRRDVTNVPAQALTMLNDPMVLQLAHQWAGSMLERSEDSTDEDRISRMFQTAIGRALTDKEKQSLLDYQKSVRQQLAQSDRRRSQLRQAIQQRQDAIDSILAPTRQRLLQANRHGNAGVGPNPIARWTFDTSLTDSIGSLIMTAHGDAHIENGALVLDGKSYLSSSPLQTDMREKTLEAWVQLDDVRQQGGGVVSIQDLQGDMFDAIVFGEQVPKRWLAGSNSFTRTQPFAGSDEDEAPQRPVHVAIAYDADGTIRGYRNGKAYGKPYKKGGPVVFAKQKSQVLLGLRHGKPSPGRLLKGRIFEARLYDRALSDEEILASSRGENFISRQELMDALTTEQRGYLSKYQRELASLQSEYDALGPPQGERAVWARVGHALMNLKEFIYLK